MLKANVGVVLVKQDSPEEVTDSGLVVVHQEEDSNRTGIVVAVGEGCSVSVGDKVIFSRDVGQETKDGDELLMAVLDDDILGVVE